MPTKDEIEAAIKRINQGIANDDRVVTMYDAVILMQAYREECFKSLGLKEFNNGK